MLRLWQERSSRERLSATERRISAAVGGVRTVNAVAADIMACVSNYERGGIEALQKVSSTGFRLPKSRGKGDRRTEARSNLDQLQHSLESLTEQVNCGRRSPEQLTGCDRQTLQVMRHNS